MRPPNPEDPAYPTDATDLDLALVSRDAELLDALAVGAPPHATDQLTVLLTAFAAEVRAPEATELSARHQEELDRAIAAAAIAAASTLPTGVPVPLVPSARTPEPALPTTAQMAGDERSATVLPLGPRLVRRLTNTAVVAAAASVVITGGVAAAVTGDFFAPIRPVLARVIGDTPADQVRKDLDEADRAIREGDRGRARDRIRKARTGLSGQDEPELRQKLDGLESQLATPTPSVSPVPSPSVVEPVTPSPVPGEPPASPQPVPTEPAGQVENQADPGATARDRWDRRTREGAQRRPDREREHPARRDQRTR